MTILKSWFDEYIYNKQIEVGFHECDFDKNAKISTLMAIASDVAGCDYTERGITHDKMLSVNQVMLLAKYHFHNVRTPKLDDVLTVKTWEKGIASGCVIRDMQMFDNSDNLCISCSSTWFILNPVTQKIVRPKNFVCKVIGENNIDIGCDPCPKILVDRDKLEKLGTYQIRPSQIDGNKHLNNSAYGDIVFDFMYTKYEKTEWTDIYFNYVHQLKCGDEVIVYGYKDSDRLYLVGKKDNEDSFVCEII